MNLWLTLKSHNVCLAAAGLSKPSKSVEFEPEEYEYISMLYVALGRSHLFLLDRDESFEEFQNCIDVSFVLWLKRIVAFFLILIIVSLTTLFL